MSGVRCPVSGGSRVEPDIDPIRFSEDFFMRLSFVITTYLLSVLGRITLLSTVSWNSPSSESSASDPSLSLKMELSSLDFSAR